MGGKYVVGMAPPAPGYRQGKPLSQGPEYSFPAQAYPTRAPSGSPRPVVRQGSRMSDRRGAIRDDADSDVRQAAVADVMGVAAAEAHAPSLMPKRRSQLFAPSDVDPAAASRPPPNAKRRSQLFAPSDLGALRAQHK